VGQLRQLQQSDAAEVVDARAKEHDHGPDRIRPAIKDVAGNGNEGRARAERKRVIQSEDEREEIEEKDVAREDHARSLVAIGDVCEGLSLSDFITTVIECISFRSGVGRWSSPGLVSHATLSSDP